MSLFDENAVVLKNLAEKGRDLTVPRLVDFAHVFDDQSAAQAFAHAAQLQGFKTLVEQVTRDQQPWDAIASMVMLPTCENITDAEARLDALARTHGGRSDGWGFLSD